MLSPIYDLTSESAIMFLYITWCPEWLFVIQQMTLRTKFQRESTSKSQSQSSVIQ